ncbi:MAG: hypothetical protein LBN07_02030 [Christensenellaceae bacterium]|jgi:hypothetical protein|nr:hypothetical protein [Christensenellaceae bacterium]
MDNKTIKEKAKELRRAYKRQYYAKNCKRVRDYQAAWWERKAATELEKVSPRGSGETHGGEARE